MSARPRLPYTFGSAIIDVRHAAVTMLRTAEVPMRTTASLIDVISLAGALNAELASWMTLVARTGSFETIDVILIAGTSGSSAISAMSCACEGSIGMASAMSCHVPMLIHSGQEISHTGV